MKDRLEKVMQHYALNASEFANATGVKRSALTHVLSGRNQPGIRFLQKILEAFPDVNGDWLLTGNGQMLKLAHSNVNNSEDEISKSQSNEEAPLNTPISPNAGKVKKIMVLYTDNRYEEFNPGL